MNGYLIALIVLGSMGLGIHAVKHGEDREDKYNFWISLLSLLIQFWLIYMAWPGGGK